MMLTNMTIKLDKSWEKNCTVLSVSYKHNLKKTVPIEYWITNEVIASKEKAEVAGVVAEFIADTIESRHNISKKSREIVYRRVRDEIDKNLDLKFGHNKKPLMVTFDNTLAYNGGELKTFSDVSWADMKMEFIEANIDKPISKWSDWVEVGYTSKSDMIISDTSFSIGNGTVFISGGASPTAAVEMQSRKLPGVNDVVAYPCECGPIKYTYWDSVSDSAKIKTVPREKDTVWAIIQHLNDTDKWSRDKIADWIDDLHDKGIINAEFSPWEEPQTDSLEGGENEQD